MRKFIYKYVSLAKRRKERKVSIKQAAYTINSILKAFLFIKPSKL